MDSEKEKNRLSDIVLERVGLTGNLLSAPVSPSLEPVVEIPSHGSQVRAGKVTGPEEYKRRFLVPAPRAAEWKTAYIDGRLHRRIAMLVRAAGCGSISGFIIRLLELHMEEHREDIASLLGEVYRPWDEDGQPGGRPAQVQGRTGCLDRRGRTRVSALIQKIMYHFKPHCYGKTKRKINLEHHYQSNYCSSHRHRRCAGYSKLYLIFNP